MIENTQADNNIKNPAGNVNIHAQNKVNHKDFIAPELDFRVVHYIERRLHNGDPLEDVKKDLLKAGNNSSKIEKHVKYVSEHRIKLPVHSHLLRATFGILGLIIIVLIALSVWNYLY